MINIKPLSATEILVTGDQRLRAWRDAHRVSVPGAQYTQQFKRGQWDGTKLPGKWCKRSRNDAWEMRCSRGLLSHLLLDLDSNEQSNIWSPPLLPPDLSTLRSVFTDYD